MPGRILLTASASHKYRWVLSSFSSPFFLVVLGHSFSYLYFQLSRWYFDLFHIFLSLVLNVEFLGHDALDIVT